MIESSTSKCLQCTFTNKYKSKGKKYVDCKGCPIKQTSEKLKWMMGCFQRVEIHVEWENEERFQDLAVEMHISALRLSQKEKELLSGTPLHECFKLFSQEEKLDDYTCDHCKE